MGMHTYDFGYFASIYVVLGFNNFYLLFGNRIWVIALRGEFGK